MSLNCPQKQAVTTTKGRLLVLAGAGSGKTRVIIHRIYHLIQNLNIPAQSILGLTFTNKAAKEMQSRLKEMIGDKAQKVELCTFHSFCMKILRKEIQRLGYTSKFSLYDEGDMKRIIKESAKEILKTSEIPSLTTTFAALSKIKTQNVMPDDEIWHDQFTKELHQRLSSVMKAYNAVDFDSLLTLTIELFEKYPEVLRKYQDQYRYIMIDEYQDTNKVQSKLSELLAKKYQNLCVVGDDDQSIYAFRGAVVQNILQFQADQTIKLEQNYRSTQNILKAANAVIQKNSSRYNKNLWSDKSDTNKIHIFHAPTEIDEAKSVIDRILQYREKGIPLKEIAILYRSNALSRNFELALMQARYLEKGQWIRGLLYEVFGGLEFSERAEIKDLLAYLRVICNPHDQEALVRILNVPRRGIANKTLELLTQKSRSEKINLFQLLKHSESLNISSKAKASLQEFVQIITEAQSRFEKDSLKQSAEWLVHRIDYQRAIREEVKSEKMRAFKWENVSEFINSISYYEEEDKNPTLQDFVSTSMLARQRPHSKYKNQDQNKVQLMTFHSAKGLEFKVCFLVGLEDHILPHERSQQEGGIEEERRLFYVAITRAKDYLTMSMSRSRKKMGKTVSTNPSRFLFEIPKDLLQVIHWKTF